MYRSVLFGRKLLVNTCGSKTLGGKPCSRPVKEGEPFCFLHRTQRALIGAPSKPAGVSAAPSQRYDPTELVEVKQNGNDLDIYINHQRRGEVKYDDGRYYAKDSSGGNIVNEESGKPYYEDQNEARKAVLRETRAKLK